MRFRSRVARAALPSSRYLRRFFVFFFVGAGRLFARGLVGALVRVRVFDFAGAALMARRDFLRGRLAGVVARAAGV